MKDVFLDWHLGDTFGWGLLGLNLFFQWANDRELRPLMGQPIQRARSPVRSVQARARRSGDRALERLPRRAATGHDGRRRIDATAIHALGNGFAATTLDGQANVARCIFEAIDLDGADAALARYDALLTGSRWNAELLERRPSARARDPEGVDTSLFCPGDRSGLFDPDRFHVFSAERSNTERARTSCCSPSRARAHAPRLRARHGLAVDLAAVRGGLPGPRASADRLAHSGRLDVVGWAHRNGIDPGAVVDLGLMPNALIPTVLREMACACSRRAPRPARACR